MIQRRSTVNEIDERKHLFIDPDHNHAKGAAINFEIIHDTYLIVQDGLDVHYLSLEKVGYRPLEAKKVNLKVNEGTISSLHQT